MRACVRVRVCGVCAQSERPQERREGERMSEPGCRAQRQSGRAVRARGWVRACVCECVSVLCTRLRVRARLGVRLFGELTGEPGPSRGLPDSAGCRGQPVLQPRPLNQPAPPDLCSPCYRTSRSSPPGVPVPQGAQVLPRAGGWMRRGPPQTRPRERIPRRYTASRYNSSLPRTFLPLC